MKIFLACQKPELQRARQLFSGPRKADNAVFIEYPENAMDSHAPNRFNSKYYPSVWIQFEGVGKCEDMKTLYVNEMQRQGEALRQDLAAKAATPAPTPVWIGGNAPERRGGNPPERRGG